MNKVLTDIFNELKHQNKVKTKAEFASEMGYNRSYVSVLFGSDTITDKVKAALVRVYGINPTFVESGKGEMFGKSTPKPEPPADDLRDIVLQMATNVNTLYASVTADRETVKSRLEHIEANLEKYDLAIEDYAIWRKKVNSSILKIAGLLLPPQVRDQIKKNVQGEHNS